MNVLAFVNACLNALATVLLVVGWLRIRRGDREGHRRAMIAACWASGIFLVGYVLLRGLLVRLTGSASREYPDVGWLTTVYRIVLVSHVVLAASLVWFVPRTLFLALKARFEEHRRIARWAFPIWLYVSVTGVVVYLMAYPFHPSGAGV